jgi:hypothetical protein
MTESKKDIKKWKNIGRLKAPVHLTWKPPMWTLSVNTVISIIFSDYFPNREPPKPGLQISLNIGMEYMKDQYQAF